MPRGVKFLVGNEAAERFTYYAMRTILVVYMTKYVVDQTGVLAPLSESESTMVFHLFAAAAYLFPILGSILADLVIGKYKTVLSLSILYTLGCVAMAVDQTRIGLWVGLGLIALGSGGIKPCMVALVGDLFGKDNKDLLGRAVRYFYMSIQLGGLLSTLISPIMLDKFGPKVAFGIPAFLMATATLIFWLGRKTYNHIPPDWPSFRNEVLNRKSMGLLGRFLVLLIFFAAFFSLYDQGSSSWVLQAEKMDLNFMGIKWLPAQVQIVNPLLCVVLVFIFDRWLFPLVGKMVNLTSLRKMSFGLFLLVPTFLLTAWIQWKLDSGTQLNISWQLLAWTIMTTGEVLAYATGLEFFYTQAPTRMKSVVQAMFLIAVALGNIFTAVVNWGIGHIELLNGLEGASYFLFFAGFMAVMTIAFIIAAMFYKEQTFLQDDK